MPYHLFDIKQKHQYYKQSVCGPKLVPQFQAIVIVIRSAPIYALDLPPTQEQNSRMTDNSSMICGKKNLIHLRPKHLDTNLVKL